MAAYATIEAYRADTGDTTSTDERISSLLEQQSAKLRADCGISSTRILTDDQALLARSLVIGAARKVLIPPSLAGMGDIAGASQASFTADGFQSSVTLASPSGEARFDHSTLKAFKRSLGCEQRIGTIWPYYGGNKC